MKIPVGFLLAAVVATVAADEAETPRERAAQIHHEAWLKMRAAVADAEREYRAALARALPLADRAEVYLLDFSIGKVPIGLPAGDRAFFRIGPYNTETRILQARKVPAQDVPKWGAAAARAITSKGEGSGAWCHYPIHGLRLWSGDELLFESSFCWHCQNYSFSYGIQDTWLGITDDADELKGLFHGFMPVPDKEKKRFERFERPGQ